MAGTSYTRQSTIADGNIITAALFNNEFNQILNAFAYASSGTTGHSHDGSAGQGAAISKIGDQDFKNKIEVSAANNRIEFYAEVNGSPVEQVRIQNGAIVPVTDSDIDLGTNSVRFKDLYVDSISVGSHTIGTTTTFNDDVVFAGVTSPGHKITFDKSLDALHFGDNVKASFGGTSANPGDLIIFHDGSNSYIRDVGDGDLYVRGDASVHIGGNTSSPAITTTTSGVTFRASNTTQAAVDTTGITLADDKIVSFGDDKDLKIYHDGSNSFIQEGGEGSLIIVAFDQIKMTQTTGVGSFPVAEFGISTGCELFHNTSKKFNTTSTGVSITGNSTVSGAVSAQTFNAASSIDTPAIEVTTLKARDGSAAGSIADSTGVVTLGSAILTTADINGGTADNVVIGGSTAAAGTFTTIGATNLQAQDGTAAGSIANSTGVTTLNSAVLTTADINGGAIDGTVIGGSTAAEGTFTAVTAGNLKASSSAPFIYSLDTDVADSELRIGCFGTGTAYRARGGTSAFGAHQFTRFNGTDTHTVLSTNGDGDIVFHTDDGVAQTKYNSSTGNLRIGANSNSASKLKVDGEINCTNLAVDDKVRIGSGGSAGTYAADLELRNDNQRESFFTASCSGTTLTVETFQSGTAIAVGQLLVGSNAQIPPNTFITALGTGTGGTGTYTISVPLTFTTIANLVTMSATENRIRFTSTDGFVEQGQPIGSIDFVSSDTSSSGTKAFIVAGHQEQAPSTYIAFGTNNNTDGTEATEVARFDENGKLLIGALTTNDTLDHIELRDTGEIRSASLATGVSTFTKSGGSGTIAEFYNDTTRVGFIRDRSEVVSSLVLDTRTDGVGISASSNRLIPTDLNGNVTSNIADLGGADQKWKDLYLGGNANVTGTLAAGITTISGAGSASTDPTAVVNRTGTADGLILSLEAGGTANANFFSTGGNRVILCDNTNNGIKFTPSSIHPRTSANGALNNTMDLGLSSSKFRNVYANGIVFDAVAGNASSNTLDDYEEGTWTPVFRDEITGGNVASGQAFNGSYTKIGNQCTLHMRIINIDPDTDVTGTNTVYITGLPFAASDESSNYRYVGSMESTRISYSGSIQPRITENTNHMVISKTNQSGSTSALQWDDITDSQADMYVSITYTV